MAVYILERKLGSGFFGTVWLAQHDALGVKVALKQVPIDKVSSEKASEFFKEPRTLMDLQHNNIVKVIDAGDMINDINVLYIAMSYYENGSIEDVYKGAPVPAYAAIQLISDACRGLEYAHSKGYLHRDIKPANIIIGDSGQALLSDFGLATKLDIDGTAAPEGYYNHLAPEVFLENQMTVATDIYAMGVTLYRMLNGDAYFNLGIGHESLKKGVISGKIPDRKKYKEFIPPALARVVNKAMNIQMSKRYSSAIELRHNLEKVRLVRGWRQTNEGYIYSYITEGPGDVYKCIIMKKKENYHFEILKGIGGRPLRHVRKYEKIFESEKEMEQYRNKTLSELALLT